MAGDLFVKAQMRESLDAFVQRITKVLNLERVERRESSNYVEEEYFAAVVLSLTVTFARADESDLDGYDFWIQLRPSGVWIADRAFVDGLADLVARRLTIAGDTVVRLPNAERKDGPKVFYSLNVSAPPVSRDQIVTREE